MLDTKPYVEHHATFGYRYIAGARMVLPRPGGGRYAITVNSMGIRSDREYPLAKPVGVRRLIVCGDSMAAGQFLNNVDRFSELLERRIHGLEVINLALEGSGTDQQLLLYEHIGRLFDHDVVILLPFLQNPRRNLVEAREAFDPRTGQMVLRPKPRFDFVNGDLVLKNVPVPAEMSEAQLRASGGGEVKHARRHRLKTRISKLPGAAIWRRMIQTIVPWEPFPEYRNAASREWRVMEALIRRFKQSAGDRPLVVAPVFYSNYVRFRMARNYWDRYSSLRRIDGVYPIDLLPHFHALAAEHGEACFQEPYDMHFSAYGHVVLADALHTELRRLALLS
jgi:carbamoyltransferase